MNIWVYNKFVVRKSLLFKHLKNNKKLWKTMKNYENYENYEKNPYLFWYIGYITPIYLLFNSFNITAQTPRVIFRGTPNNALNPNGVGYVFLHPSEFGLPKYIKWIFEFIKNLWQKKAYCLNTFKTIKNYENYEKLWKKILVSFDILVL